MFELLKMAHLITISLASGLMLSHYVLLRASARREAEPGLALARRTVASITSFGVVLVWISGVTLLWSRFAAGEEELSAWFYAKLVFVVLFTVAHVMQRVHAARFRSRNDIVGARRTIERWVSIAWLMALFAICAAVISFK